MRRVSISSALAGMVLKATVYDIKGFPVLEVGDKLSQANIPLLARTTSAEILIDDPNTDDILVGTTFPADLEAKACQALNILMVMLQGLTTGIPKGGLVGLMHPLNRLIDCVYPDMMGEPEVAGSHTLIGTHYVHPIRVAELSMAVASLAGADRSELQTLGLAASLMNLGYLNLRSGVLDAPRELEKHEWEQVKQHPNYSLEMLADSDLPAVAREAIADHHEHWDGSGYPRGKKGHDISLFARIIKLCDAYVALRSYRAYRRQYRPHEAIEFILAFSGEIFDPELATIFVRQIPQYPSGVTVLLNSGEGGVISNPNTGHVARPVVRVLGVNGVPVKRPYEVDLSAKEHQKRIIVEVDL